MTLTQYSACMQTVVEIEQALDAAYQKTPVLFRAQVGAQMAPILQKLTFLLQQLSEAHRGDPS